MTDSQNSTELEELQNQTGETRRVISPGAEKWLHKPIKVLDQGFVRLVDYMGDDAAIVQAARVSYGKGTKSARNDEGLIRYLMRHRHSTPFEMCEAKFHIKLPIFIARQWIRHRTANVNEYSARYSVLDREFYTPSRDQLSAQSKQNNQGRGAVLEDKEAEMVLALLKDEATRSFQAYDTLLNSNEDPDRSGLARELARMTLPLSTYTQWYWKIDLQNLLHFLSLRADPHAQYEIRVFADAMLQIVADWVPMTERAFQDYRVNAFHMSGPMIDVLKRKLAGEEVSQENSNLSAREWSELWAALD